MKCIKYKCLYQELEFVDEKIPDHLVSNIILWPIVDPTF